MGDGKRRDGAPDDASTAVTAVGSAEDSPDDLRTNLLSDAVATRVERTPNTATRPRDPTADLPTELIGERWKVVSRLGSGGFAEVYRARDTHTHVLVALKVLRHELASNDRILERFGREVDHVTALSHPSIAEIFDVGLMPDGRPYYAMELLHGRTLTQHLRTCGRLSVPEALAIMGPLCDALALAHDRGIVHRDLTSSNVFLADGRTRGRVVLLDFGIAKPLDAPAITGSREVVGTPSAMAPEQLAGNASASISPRTDVYLLGVLLFQMLAGQRPFPADTPARAWELLSTRCPLLSSHVAVDPAIDRLVIRAMRFAPAERFADAREFWNALGDAWNAGAEQRTSRAAALFVEVRVPSAMLADPSDALLDQIDIVLDAVKELAERARLDIALQAQSSLLIVDRSGEVARVHTLAEQVRQFVLAATPRDLHVNLCLHLDEVHRTGAGDFDPSSPVLSPTRWAADEALDGIVATPPFAERLAVPAEVVPGLPFVRIDRPTG